MTKILNRGLNFCVTPLTLNITEVLVDYRKYERKVKWVEFFNDQNEETDTDSVREWIPEIFRKEKSNVPQNSSNAVKTFLSSVKSDITGSTFNKTRSNISKDEAEALKTLIKLQRNCVIIIKPCDKGAGIIIVDHDKYVSSCQRELESVTNNGERYYKEITPIILEKAKQDIDNALTEALKSDIFSKTEFDAMSAKDKKAGKFYQLFKIHKKI
jgi:hypothetical protein